MLGLQTVRVTGVAGEHTEIKFSDFARAPIAILIFLADKTLLDQRLRHSELIQHIHRGRVERGSPQGLGQVIECFEQDDWNARLRQAQRGRATDRARARLESLWGGTSAKRIDRARTAALALV